eukprot:CAMPEP_0170515678 /NCGR_PEP_ID=MMETSP0209-20121228/2082_1 /TAXON_ID=665100 ORGANISM="Litonotus pictus, Strain P1" /NCGR_SAMPLE_ID=MMETSP0209 /ASSEMBLY_ACC=CAM_ASM_000301 /LENGTH=438 /DNA_ID=CAMNT_0010800271 /DNA_START=6 /DNA_END=1322 /DNA_ORIENTATION=+
MLDSSVNIKKLLVGFTGAAGIITLMNAIRKHYLRLKNKNKKAISARGDNSSENMSQLPEKEEKISEELIEKLVEKIKNSLIHTTCICLDKFIEQEKKLNPFNPDITVSKVLGEEKKEDDIEVVQEENQVATKKEGENPNIDKDIGEFISQIETKTEFLPNFEKGIFSYGNLKQGGAVMTSYQIMDFLVDNEKKIISSFNVKKEEYQTMVKKLIPTNKKIKDYITVLNLFMQGLDKKELYPLHFSPALTNNYIKIISNIYYINITKSAQKFKQEIMDANKFSDSDPKQMPVLEKIFNDMYKAFLKDTRQEVADFYGVKGHDVFELPVKVLLRIYPFYLEQNEEARKKYHALTENVNKLIGHLEKKVVVPQFTDPKHPDFSLKPLDKEFDFQGIIEKIEGKSVSQSQSQSNMDNQENQENQELLNKFNKKFNEEQGNEED